MLCAYYGQRKEEEKWVKLLGLPRDSCFTYLEDIFDFFLRKEKNIVYLKELHSSHINL
ncbi:hypothetical protein Syun_029507 [Stephania yunnanensis]|uniref:Uncharacterized protein n=1 Tax=Stephania yunnanensis TaxID=152371 RepID=A0AAP0EDB3_9MAGN